MSSAIISVIWLIIVVITDETSISYNQPKIWPNATWCENGTTFVDQSIISENPRGIFVDSNNTIFVAAHQKNQILIWLEGNINPVRCLTVNLSAYTTLFVAINGDIYFQNKNKAGRVEKWAMDSMSSVLVAQFSRNCVGLFLDISNTLYCSILDEHRVVKISLDGGTSTITVVAGTGSEGSKSNELCAPWGIFVDINFDLYVADAANSRIQLFRPGQLNGETVAGNGIPKNLILNFPTDIILDADGVLYIADNWQHRIIQSGRDTFQCIIGCTGKPGSAPNELHNSYSIRFDSYGNLYVAEENNHRIQKFDLSTSSCETSVTSMSSLHQVTSCSSIAPTSQPPQESTSSAVSPTCLGIGPNCDIAGTPCDMLKPCKNSGTCNNTNTTHRGYSCSCPPGFNGTQCEFDHRPCKPHTCWNNGSCENTSSTEFSCQCAPDWEGTHCERKVNYCQNVTCQNRGVCRPLFGDYKCECLGDNYYSGRQCEIKTRKIVILTIVSKSFGYVAIIALITVAMFVIIMDVLKYCFGIDLTYKEVEEIRRKKLAKKRKPVIQRFFYVNAPPPSKESVPPVEETAV